MHDQLKKGFQLGQWRVRPLEGVLSGPEGQRRLQPKAMDVLLWLAASAGEVVERKVLVKAVWGDRAVTDEPLTRCIGELRQALGESRVGPGYIQTVHKRGYKLLAPVTFEGTDKEIRLTTHTTQAEHESARDRAEPVAKGPLVLWASVPILLATILAGLYFATRSELDPDERRMAATTPDKPAIVVLPFLNLSEDPNDEYLSDGLAETLTQVLSRVSGLKVIARTSAFAFKNKPVDVRVLGETLGVDAVVEGSVQKQGNLLRITTQLIATRDGDHLWAAAFDRPQESIFVVQDEIATAVTAALQVTLLNDPTQGSSRHGTQNFDAYKAYLLGQDRLNRRTTETLNQAIGYFARAVELDPDYTLAYVGLADAHLIFHWYGNVSLEATVNKAEPAIRRALELDPDLAEAYATTGMMHFYLREYELAEAALQRAITMSPNYARAYFVYGSLFNDTGRPAEALVMHRAALDLDPLAPATNTAIAVALEKLGRFEEALDGFQKVIDLDPNYAAAKDRAARLNWSVFARADEAARLHREAIATDPDSPVSLTMLAELFLDLGADQVAQHWIEQAEQHGGDVAWPHRARSLLLVHRREQPDERRELATRWVKSALSAETVEVLLRVARDVHLDKGEYQAAQRLYENTFPELFQEEVSSINWLNFGAAIDVAYVLYKMGEQQHADLLLDRAEAHINTLPRLGCCGSGIADVEIHAIRGQEAEALATLERAVSEGWRMRWWWDTDYNPNLSSLWGKEPYEALMTSLREEMAVQLERLESE